MSEFIYTRKMFGFFPVAHKIPKPHLYFTSAGLGPCWVRQSGNSYPGFGKTPAQAWNDWANWALI